MRDRLVEIVKSSLMKHIDKSCKLAENITDDLLSEGVIVPPCKVGDTLYVISQMRDKRMLPFINSYEVTSITIKRKSMAIYHEMDGFIKIFKQSDFGKTVFLTKEEAEKALAERSENGK